MSTTNNIAPEIKDKIVELLNEMLSAENAAVDRLDWRIQECLLSEGKQQLQHHQDETRQHQERLRQIITDLGGSPTDRKSTRLNSSHANISYAVFCLKKKKSTNKLACDA